MGKLMLLKGLTRAYGILVALILGSYLISLAAHDDLMLLKTPQRFDWIVGEVIALLIILWGVFFALSDPRKRKVMGLLCVFLAVLLSILVGFTSPFPRSGVFMVVVLFLLPSVTTILLSQVSPSPTDGR